MLSKQSGGRAEVKAVILAAGEGSRMRPLTYTRPKVMLPIANKPILEHLLIAASEAGIEEFIFVVGYCEAQVRDYFGKGEKWGVSIEYASQKKQAGTADAVRMVQERIEGRFLLLNGDIIVDSRDIAKILSRRGTVLSVIEVKDATDLGTVEASKRKVVRIYEKVEKPPSLLANAGLYLFTPEVFDAIARTEKSPRGEYEITSTLQLMIDKGHDVWIQELGSWVSLNYPWDLLTANEVLLKDIKPRNAGIVEENVVLRGKVVIGEDTVVRSGTYIIGPVMIGQRCDIGPNCYIRPATAIGDSCHLGASVEVKNSIIMKGTKVPHLNYVGDSVIGEGCNFGAGTKIANLRLDKKEIWVNSVNTKRHKLGAIIGDRVETGINASINVGSIIGNDAMIGPGAVASGVIAPNSKVL
jgi:UDP-N-acetylglucosamine diphosphorylase/glucosamine-1-phosphate N-acetyltransferase